MIRPDEFADLDRILDEGDEVEVGEDQLEVDIDLLLEESRVSVSDDDDEDNETDDDDDLEDEDDAPEARSRVTIVGLSEAALRARSREAAQREIEACRSRCAARRAA